MSERTATQLPACPVETTLSLISDKWKVLILRDLLPGTKRFGELKKSIGHVSQKVLTAQLREMEASGLLTRTVYAEVPPRVEYTLTDLGYSLRPCTPFWTPCGTGGKDTRKSAANSPLPFDNFPLRQYNGYRSGPKGDKLRFMPLSPVGPPHFSE
jgi:DNA-binding HxlR family transcriptional regulator